MELKNGVKEYLDSLVNDDDNYAVLVYGSHATGYATDTSDIDIFVVREKNKCYRKVMVIDDCELEGYFANVGYVASDIITDLLDNNAFFESVLNRNIVLKNRYDLIEYLKNHLEKEKKKIRKTKRNITPRMNQLLNEFYECFIQEGDLYSYFNLLDQIRMTLAHINNLSDLNVGKVYDMYSDPKHAKDDYYLTLPTKKFIALFDEAVRKQPDKERIKWLFDFIDFQPFDSFEESDYFVSLNDFRRKSILIHMDKMINKAVKMLVQNNPYKDYVYHVVLNHLYRFYDELYNEVTEEFIQVLECAKKETDTILRSNYLKQLFELLEGKYAFDYKNYTLYFN